MSVFTLVISCLTMSNYNISGSYAMLFTASDFTFTTRHIHNWTLFQPWLSCFVFSGAISNFPPLFLHSILDTFQSGGSSSGVISFCLFILSMGFSRQEYWSGLSFPSPVDNVLSELSSMTHLSSMALQGMAHSFIELHKAVIHVIILVSFWSLWFSFWRCDCGIVILASSVF